MHCAFGESLAVLAGDALIVLAFQTLAPGRGAVAAAAGAAARDRSRRGVGMPSGIVAGQAWECEPQRRRWRDYQRAKTGALFAAATMAGARPPGADAEPWRALGERLGEAYQVADDIRDVAGDPRIIGKPIGRDVALGSPERGQRARPATARSRTSSGWWPARSPPIPPCPGAAQLRALMRLRGRAAACPRRCRDELVRVAA